MESFVVQSVTAPSRHLFVGFFLLWALLFPGSPVFAEICPKGSAATAGCVSLNLDPSISTSGNGPYVNFSNVRLTFVRAAEPLGSLQDLEGVLNAFKEKGADPHMDQIVLGFTLQLSAVPALDKGHVLEKAKQKVDDRAASYVEMVNTQEGLLRQKLTAEVDKLLASRPEYKPFRSLLVAEAQQKAAPYFTRLAGARDQIAMARQAAINELDQRGDELVAQFTAQDISLSLGYFTHQPIAGGSLALFAKMGQFPVSGNGPTDANHQTRLEELLANNSLAQRTNNTAPTIGGDFSAIYRNSEGKTLEIHLAVFHDRPPVANPSDYVAMAFSMTPEEWDEHQDRWNINSSLLRVIYSTIYGDGRTPGFLIYGSCGVYNESNSCAAGGQLNLTPKTRAYLDWSSGNRPHAPQNALSLYFVHDLDRAPLLGPDVSIYAGVEKYRGAEFPITLSTSGETDVTVLALGGSKTKVLYLPQAWGGHKVMTRMNMTFNHAYIDPETGPSQEDNIGYFSLIFQL